MSTDVYRELRAFAEEIAREAGELTLRYFRTGVRVDAKADASPVTVADREAELLLRARIEARYPDHGIVGEEYGRVREDAEYVWVLDPIDGTKSFVAGVPLYTNLVAVVRRGESVVGVINAPATGERVSASLGGGCHYNGAPARAAEADGSSRPLVLTSCTGTLFQHHPELTAALLQRYPFHRTWADGYGYLLVATGRAQAMLDPIMEDWDVAPLPPIISEAGGVFSNWRGEHSLRGRASLAATRGLHGDIMDLIARHARALPA